MKYIKKCTDNKCNTYTMNDLCPTCNAKAQRPLPPKFSTEDKYADLKRQAKQEERKAQGLIQ